MTTPEVPVQATDSAPRRRARSGRPAVAQKFLSPTAAAHFLGMPRSTVYDLVRRGIIPSKKLPTGKNGAVLIEIAALESALASWSRRAEEA